MEADVSTLAYLAGALRKPVAYFIPQGIRNDLQPVARSPELQGLLIQIHRLRPEDLGGITPQMRALADLQDTRLIDKRRARG